MTSADGDAVTADSPAKSAETAPRNGSGQPRRWRRIMIMMTAIGGILASIAMSAAVDGWRAHVRELRYAHLAGDYMQAINSGLLDAATLLYALRAYFESRDRPVTRTEFESFSHALRTRAPGLRDTAWAPLVSAAQRETFEQAVRESGMPNFRIFEHDAAGRVVPAGDRAAYFPVLYLEPGLANRSVMGFDVASEPVRNEVMKRALAADKPAATLPIKLVNMQRPNDGIMSFIPVRQPGGSATDPPAGVVMGVFETAAMIENILTTRVRLAGLNLYLFNPDGPLGDRLIYWHGADGQKPPSEQSLIAGPHWFGALELLDQRWGALLIPSDVVEFAATDRASLAALACGLFTTASFVIYLWRSHRRTLELERLAGDLHETTTELRRNGAALAHLARHDMLTGLANRMAFRDEVASGLRRARRGQGMALLYLDLDRFKAVNDTLGHGAGDRLLCEVAARLRATVREADCITRLGGDEFAVAQTGTDQPASSENLACRLIETLSRPYEIDGQIVVVGVSIGITVAERGDIEADQLLARADMALYAAKRDGRGTFRFFVNTLESDAQARRGLEMDLRHALDHDELALFYQPQVSLVDGRICGMEALLRWHHPDRGLVMPGDFIRCAEETGLIVPIGAWVLQTALRAAAGWPEEMRVAVNLSPHQVIRDDLVETVESALAETGQSGSRLELEITENALLEQNAAGHAALRHLRAMGVRISLDDFGAGYASLSHLRRFPFDRIKVDRSFVASMADTPQSGAIVRAILQLAATLNITSLAEGVETQAQLDKLVTFGCNEAQGMLLSAPQPAEALPSLLAEWPVARWTATVTRYQGRTVRIPLLGMTTAGDVA